MIKSFQRARTAALIGAAAVVIGGMGLGMAVFDAAVAETAAPEADAPKEVALSQSQIDGLVAAQKDLRSIEGAQDKPDPAAEAKLGAAVKSHGFADLAQFNDVSYSVGLVMAGLDPETKEFVGPAAVIHKQIKEIQADTSMPPKEKKEALAELNGSLQQGGEDKPMAANIALVKANLAKLATAMQQAD